MQNTVEDNTVRALHSVQGRGLASTNTLEVRVVHNTVCDNGTDIVGEGGDRWHSFPVPNAGNGERAGQGRSFRTRPRQ